MPSRNIAALNHLEHRKKPPAAKDGKGQVLEMSKLPRRTVLLNVYDVGDSSTLKKVNGWSASLAGGGVFHGGVEVYGTEWSYGYTDSGGTGVGMCTPRAHPQHAYRQTVNMGQTKLSEERVNDIIGQMVDDWPGCKYHLLKNNCLDFCNAFLDALGLQKIPAWVDRYGRTAERVGRVLYSPISAAKRASGLGMKLAGTKRKSQEDQGADMPAFLLESDLSLPPDGSCSPNSDVSDCQPAVTRLNAIGGRIGRESTLATSDMQHMPVKDMPQPEFWDLPKQVSAQESTESIKRTMAVKKPAAGKASDQHERLLQESVKPSPNGRELSHDSRASKGKARSKTEPRPEKGSKEPALGQAQPEQQSLPRRERSKQEGKVKRLAATESGAKSTEALADDIASSSTPSPSSQSQTSRRRNKARSQPALAQPGSSQQEREVEEEHEEQRQGKQEKQISRSNRRLLQEEHKHAASGGALTAIKEEGKYGQEEGKVKSLEAAESGNKRAEALDDLASSSTLSPSSQGQTSRRRNKARSQPALAQSSSKQQEKEEEEHEHEGKRRLSRSNRRPLQDEQQHAVERDEAVAEEPQHGQEEKEKKDKKGKKKQQAGISAHKEAHGTPARTVDEGKSGASSGPSKSRDQSQAFQPPPRKPPPLPPPAEPPPTDSEDDSSSMSCSEFKQSPIPAVEAEPALATSCRNESGHSNPQVKDLSARPAVITDSASRGLIDEMRSLVHATSSQQSTRTDEVGQTLPATGLATLHPKGVRVRMRL